MLIHVNIAERKNANLSFLNKKNYFNIQKCKRLSNFVEKTYFRI